MNFVLYTNALSAHQIPIAREIVKRIGADNFRYIYTSKCGQKLQESRATDSWIEYLPSEKTNDWLENADVMLVGGIRPIDLMEKRLAAGKLTLYMSERWFKPIQICSALNLPGWVRLLVPSYWKMARRFAKLFENQHYRFLPIGPWSLLDMKKICGIMNVALSGKQVIKWGDFVAPSKFDALPVQEASDVVRVLWVGRLLNWKRVDTIVRAVGEHANLKRMDDSMPEIILDIYGNGPAEKSLKRMAAQYGDVVKFHPPVPIEEVRRLMREHDVYILASNGYEGWGAVVSEALEEGMTVLGTYEAGSSATILPEGSLFHAGDWRTLNKMLSDISGKTMENHVNGNCASLWTAEAGAKALCEYLEDGGSNE